MIKACAVAPVAVFLSVVAMASDWPYPEDIPVTEPVAVGLAGTKPADIVRFLYARGANDARISPDGQWVAYKHSISGEPQLWVVKNDGGWPEQLTFGTGITFFEWLPDSEHLLVGRDADGNESDYSNEVLKTAP